LNMNPKRTYLFYLTWIMINAVSAERGSDVHVEESGMQAHSEISNPINYYICSTVQ